MFGWTWESNPGPNGFQTPHYPPSQLHAFVSIVGNKYYNKTINTYAENIKTRARLNAPIMNQHAVIFLAFPAKAKLDSGGF